MININDKAIETKPSLLQVQNLSISFSQYTKGLRQNTVQVVKELNLEIKPSEFLAIVGASGSGKSLLAHALMGILPSNAHVQGSLIYEGQQLTPELQSRLRGKEIALIPQSVNCLNPLMRVGKQVRSGIRLKPPRATETQRAIFHRYGLVQQVEQLYPFQLSGGMARRVLIATAAVSGIRLVVADEPTPGLDHCTVIEILGHLRELANKGTAVLLITHDIESALTVADRIAVFYAGTTVEVSLASNFSQGPSKLRHPYSRALWNALPANGFQPIAGSQPAPGTYTTSCPFYQRCSIASQICSEKFPPFRELRDGIVRCWHAT